MADTTLHGVIEGTIINATDAEDCIDQVMTIAVAKATREHAKAHAASDNRDTVERLAILGSTADTAEEVAIAAEIVASETALGLLEDSQTAMVSGWLSAFGQA